MARYLILDPASPEFNRGSFCYLPYILFSAINSRTGNWCDIKESFVTEDLDTIKWKNYDEVWVALWSYPQIDACRVIERFAPVKVKFFGYKGLIRQEKFDLANYEDLILEGIENYFYMMDHFKNILLSDCDMHLKKYEGKVYPLFASYGCPKGCLFCPSSMNCGKKITFMDTLKVRAIFRSASAKLRTNIHFTDEDFFLDIDRARTILEYAREIGGFRFIALASASSLAKYLRKYGWDHVIEQVKVAEVGYEAASAEVLESMNKSNEQSDIDYIRANFHNEIFWLTMTFFPGETVQSLRQTGDWMRLNGTDVNSLYDRIKGNSTFGGLGQFFQPYPDTVDIKKLEEIGIVLSHRPIRLLPSFVPNSFLDCKISLWRQPTVDEMVFFDFYKVEPPQWWVEGKTIREYALESPGRVSDALISLAIASKMGVIE